MSHQRMRAWNLKQYGPPSNLVLEEGPLPVPQGDEIRVQVRAISVNAGDCHLTWGNPWIARPMFGGFRRPTVSPGMDVAGVVDAVGESVTRFHVGDEVVGDLSAVGFGGFAEVVCASERVWAMKPAGIGFAEAAAVPAAAVTALQGLRDVGGLKTGERVLVRGASSGVGSFAVQIARLLGGEVTATCRPEKREALEQAGVTRWMEEGEAQEAFDLILDIAAFVSPLRTARLARRGGRYVLVGGSMPRFFQVLLFGPLLSKFSGRSIRAFAMKPDTVDLQAILAWMEIGKLKPVISHTFSFEEIPKALTALEQREVTGKCVVRVGGGGLSFSPQPAYDNVRVCRE